LAVGGFDFFAALDVLDFVEPALEAEIGLADLFAVGFEDADADLPVVALLFLFCLLNFEGAANKNGMFTCTMTSTSKTK